MGLSLNTRREETSAYYPQVNLSRNSRKFQKSLTFYQNGLYLYYHIWQKEKKQLIQVAQMPVFNINSHGFSQRKKSIWK